MNTTTHNYYCYCGCGDAVTVEFTGGFQGTSIRVSACPSIKAKTPAVNGAIFPRSMALRMTPLSANTIAHRDGLVTFGGAR